MDLLTFLAPLGIGGALAAFIFYFYRQDVVNGILLTKEDRKVLLETITNNTSAITDFQGAVRENADAVRENTKTLESMKEFCRYRGEVK